MEEEHTIVEDILSRTDEYSEKLTTAIHSIREYLPEMTPPPSIEQLITSQDSAQIGMAGHLESLAAHYDQMCNALREREAGDVFGEDDLQDSSLVSDQLCQIRDTNQEHIKRLSNVLDELDELGDIMTEMLQTQETVEVSVHA
ncbi:hypothetical protein HHX47_DHR7000269 [Lentinula edodes]|nr:hypothetical protein HHX47_DHR7000269 [Lentinula edodes]